MATLVTITGTFRDAGQNLAPDGSTVTVRPTAPILDAAGAIVVNQVPVVIDLVSGSIPANTKLYATDDPTSSPENVLYEFTVAIVGAKPYKFRAPISYVDTTVDLSTVVEPEAEPAFFAYALASDLASRVSALSPQVAGIMTGYGHSEANIGPGARAATLSGQHYAGDDVLTVTTAGSLAPGKWRIRETADQNSEHVIIPQDADCSGTVVKITAPLVNDHANNTTVVDPAPYCGERIGRMLAAEYRNRAISGSTLCKAGAPGSANYGGFNRPLRELPVPPASSGASTSPAPGLLFLFTLLNDLGDANLTAAGSTKIINAARHALRAILARAALGRLFESETAFPGSSIYTTFTGTFATVNSTTQNTGTGYESGVGTITHAPPAGWAGPAGSPTRCVDFGFIANYEGGGFAASEIHFTVDGTEVYPTGSNSAGPYSASNPYTTVDINPATFGTGLASVARIPVTPTGGAQSIVATTGAGGASFDWVGWEADFIMPTILPNVFVTPGCTAQQTTAIPLMNTALQAVVDEFDSPYICVPDLYTALSPAGVPGDFWNTAVDTTHVDAARGHLKVAEVCVEAFQALSLPIAQKASL